MTNYKLITKCIACDSENLKTFLDLGEQPLANSYKLNKDDTELYFPLSTNYCSDCSHVQLSCAVNPELLFKDYAYITGVNKPMLEYFKWFANMSLEKFETKPKNVLDIGCNDASQLDFYKELGLETYGVDPATNLYEQSKQRHNIICDYFKEGIIDKKFDLVLIQNAFAHNDDQFNMLKAALNLLNDDGLLFIQVSQVDMVSLGQFDTIYHEHISFYCIKSMNEICKRANANIIQVIKHSIHGNSFIFVISKTKSNAEYLNQLIKTEEESLNNPNIFQKIFKSAANAKRDRIKFNLEEIKKLKIPIIGYGAPAKANTFLNYAKLKLDLIIDETPTKINKFTPGSSIPIYGKDEVFSLIEKYDKVCFVILAWNYYDDIKKKIQSFRPGKNDYFITY